MKFCLLLFSTLLLSLSAYCQTGTLDPSFGINGTAKTNFEPLNSLYPSRSHKVLQKQDGFSYVLLEIEGQTTLQRYTANGALDLNFANNGYAAFAGLISNDAIVQSDGKIVTAGRISTSSGTAFALARYNIDGSLDNSFGSGGKVVTPLAFENDASNAEAYSVAVQSNGKIIAAGRANRQAFSYFALVRYNADGTLDNSFGTSGKVATPFLYGGTFATYASAKAIKLQGDEKIVAVGKAITTNGNAFALARYNADGSLDNSFGDGGQTVTYFPIDNDFRSNFNTSANAVAIQTDGKIVAAGTAYVFKRLCGDETSECEDVLDGQEFALARYNTDGTPDNSFGTDGKVTTYFFKGSLDYHRDAIASSISIQTNGKIVVGGTTDDDRYSNDEGYVFSSSYALARYNVDGSLDNTFDGDGKLTTKFSGSSVDFDLFGTQDVAGISSFAIQTDGAILAVGTVTSKIVTYDYEEVDNTNYALTRYNADGTPDQTFGNGGELANTGLGNASYTNAVQQGDGKIIAVGKVLNGNKYSDDGRVLFDGSDFVLARYNINGSLDNTFGNGGKVKTIFSSQRIASANAVLIQSDGKIVAGGDAENGGSDYNESRNYDFALARYKANGTLDSTFGTNGKVLTRFAAEGEIATAHLEALCLQSNGQILAAGWTDFAQEGELSTGRYFALARYNADGSLDNSFGNGGKAVVRFGSAEGESFGVARSIGVLSNGKILISGFKPYFNSSDIELAFLRFNADGTPDQSFGSGGAVKQNGFPVTSFILQPDGKILIAGEGVLARLNADGSFDQSFGNGGRINYPGFSFKSLDLTNEEKIVAAGTLQGASGSSVVFLRYNADGTPDGNFGTNGQTATPVNANINNIVFSSNRVYGLGQVHEIGYLASVTAFQYVASPNTLTFTLVNSTTDKDIQELKDGDVLDLATLPRGGLNIRANPVPAKVGSVMFELSGQQNRKSTENGAPYALFKNLNGNYFDGSLQPGDYTLTATPYSKADGKGTKGTPTTIHFKIVYPAAVTRFVLVNANTGKDIQELKDGDELNIATLPADNISIRAYTNPNVVGSVVFNLQGQQSHSQTENLAPYALFGDNGKTYIPWTPETGSYTLSAMPYSAPRSGGARGTGYTVHFTVVNTAPAVTSVFNKEQSTPGHEEKGAVRLLASPNPFASQSVVRFSVPATGYATLNLYDAKGVMAKSIYHGKTEGGKQYEVSLDGGKFPAGIYLLRLTTGNQVSTLKVVLTR